MFRKFERSIWLSDRICVYYIGRTIRKPPLTIQTDMIEKPKRLHREHVYFREIVYRTAREHAIRRGDDVGITRVTTLTDENRATETTPIKGENGLLFVVYPFGLFGERPLLNTNTTPYPGPSFRPIMKISSSPSDRHECHGPDDAGDPVRSSTWTNFCGRIPRT